jgi:hypothetical protein
MMHILIDAFDGNWLILFDVYGFLYLGEGASKSQSNY